MNKKLLIGALVGSIIMFFWQFLAWGVTDLHADTVKHTPNQEVIMQVLNENLEEGHYFLPNLPKTASKKEHAEYNINNVGKPWAQVSYHKSMEGGMGMNLFRGWTVDFISMLLLCWFLLKISNLNFTTTLLVSLAVGFIGFLSVNYIEAIWFKTNVLSALYDMVIMWGLIGVWFGWWLNRK